MTFFNNTTIYHLQQSEQIFVRKKLIFQFTNFVYMHRLRNTIFRRVRKIAKIDY